MTRTKKGKTPKVTGTEIVVVTPGAQAVQPRPRKAKAKRPPVVKANIPVKMNAQMLRKCIKTEIATLIGSKRLSKIAYNIIMMMVNPQVKGVHQRIPNQLNLATAIIPSKTVITVSANAGTGTHTDDKGRFAIIITPSPGQHGWWVTATSVNAGPNPSTGGASTKFGVNTNIATKAAWIDPNKTWRTAGSWAVPIPGPDATPEEIKAYKKQLKHGVSLDDVDSFKVEPKRVPPKRVRGVKRRTVEAVIAPENHWLYEQDSQSEELVGVFQTVGANWGIGYNGGLMSTGRTLAMSAYFRCSEAALLNGGDLTVARVNFPLYGTVMPLNGPTLEADEATAQYRDPGSLLEWETLAEIPLSQQGNLKEGGYVWWSPYGVEELQTPQSLITTPNPVLMICGQAQAGPDNTFPAHVGVLEINTLYEITSGEQYLDYEVEPYNQADMDIAFKFLSTQNVCHSNDGHVKWLNKLLAFLAGVGAAGLTVATGGAAGVAIAAGLGAATTAGAFR